MDSIIYKRGQVWLWGDPIFGSKSEKNIVPPGEVTYRYTRYVLIVQNDSSMWGEVILCIPLSSEHNRTADVQIPMSYLWHQSVSYAKCDRIFPAHAKMLQRYICEVPEEVMREIDGEIISLLCPYITDAYSTAEIKSAFNIDMTKKNHFSGINTESIDGIVGLFIAKSIEYTYDMGDSVSITDVKNAFDIFCVNNNIPLVEDMYHFVESFLHTLDSDVARYSGWRGLSHEICGLTKFRGIAIRETPRPVISVNGTPIRDDSQEVIDLKKQIDEITKELQELRQLTSNATTVMATSEKKPSEHKRNNWSDRGYIQEFITFCNTNGKSEAARRYGISEATVAKYYRKYAATVEENYQTEDPNVDEIPESQEELPENLDTAKSVQAVADPSIDHNKALKSISNFSNMIRNYMRNIRMYEKLKIDGFMDDVEFYAKLQSFTYFTLLAMLGIEKEYWGYHIPKITADSKYIETWRFFETIYDDPRVFMSQEADKMITLYRKYHDPKGGVHPDWIQYLYNKFQNTGMENTRINLILDKIKEMFIEQP